MATMRLIQRIRCSKLCVVVFVVTSIHPFPLVPNLPFTPFFVFCSGWMQYQRKLNHEGSLPEDKVDLIDKLGDFDWDITPREKSNHKNKDPAAWESRFKDMVAFKEENGHCTVPPIYEPNPALAKWVASQKAKHAKGNLPEDKLGKMTCIMHLLQKTWSPISHQPIIFFFFRRTSKRYWI